MVRIGILFVAIVPGLTAGLPGRGAAQACEDGDSARPSLGVGVFHCQGGLCRAGYATALHGRGPAELRPDQGYEFSVEPSLWDLTGPAEGRLRQGDVLVAVNGHAITSPAGGRELEAMQPGAPQRLSVRRGDRIEEVTVVPALSCLGPWVSAGPEPRPSGSPAEFPRHMAEVRRQLEDAQRRMADVRRLLDRSPDAFRPAPGHPAEATRGSLGIAIGCDRCRWAADTGETTARWHFALPPVVVSVRDGSPAHRAGLQVGDVLTHADDLDLTTADGARRLSTFRPGEPVRLRYTRGGRSGAVTLTAEFTR